MICASLALLLTKASSRPDGIAVCFNNTVEQCAPNLARPGRSLGVIMSAKPKHSRVRSTFVILAGGACREAVAESSPMVGDREPLTALRKGSSLLSALFCELDTYHPPSASIKTDVCIEANFCTAEYEAGGPVFLQKIQTLDSLYQAIRRTRGDGNCFFRSFIFAYMEDLVNTHNLPERNRLVCCTYVLPLGLCNWHHHSESTTFTGMDIFASLRTPVSKLLPP